ncbi:hypothetical protein K388_07396 [Streptomyces sp. KhCrAH-43]|uniref:hypothetical protein n=1 Tax=unclassified Streptomyces TaxID=2593676 RepID=UPI000DC35451|nr:MULTISPECIES: hypothetical protein [unclassified Streptomyces]RAJ44033.1 hypothetical protein K388_07396 [Streptomyces sp. KhCrAH-43]
MVEDPATSARTVELACVAIQSMFGALPQSMTAERGPREYGAIFRECERMTPVQRRATVNTAMNTLIGTMPH